MSEAFLIHSNAGLGEMEERPPSFEALQDVIRALDTKYRPLCGIPYTVDLVRPGVGRLAVGFDLAKDEWILSYFPESDDEWVLNSMGDPSAKGGVSFYFGDFTPMSRKYVISGAAAWPVVRAWWCDREVSNTIGWTREIFWYPFD